MKSLNEKNIILIIKYSLPLLIIVLSTILTISLYLANKSILKEEINNLMNKFISTKKEKIKNDVDSLYSFIAIKHQESRNELKKELKSAINNAYKIIENIYQENKNLSKEHIIKLIKDALRELRYRNDNSYIFIYTLEGTNILHPMKKKFENKSFLNYKDKYGTYIFKELRNEFKKKNDIFYSWYWKDAEKDFERKKIGYFKKFKELDIFIGIGEYEYVFEKKVQKIILKYISNTRFGINSYPFIISFDGIYLSHVRSEYINQDAFKVKDMLNAKKIISSMIGIAGSSPDFITYTQLSKLGKGEEAKKTSYIKGFTYWNWLIGIGYYHDDVEVIIAKKSKELNEKFNDYISNILIVSFLLTIFLLFISIYISKTLENKFIEYKESIKEHIKDNNKHQELMAQQAKMAAMGEMIGNIAHQWRQPLSAITTAASGLKLQKEYKMLSDDILMNSLDGISESAQYLSKTIDDFRNFFDSNKEYIEFSLKQSIFKALKLIKSNFKNNNIEIIKNIEDIKYLGIENEFIQVILNIMNNSRDEFINMDNSRKLIFIDIYKKENKIYIKIKDNALGINENIISRVFEPYFTTKHKSQGTGIGLYMSLEIIEKHMNGILSVKNKNYEYEDVSYTGAEFCICFNDK